MRTCAWTPKRAKRLYRGLEICNSSVCLLAQNTPDLRTKVLSSSKSVREHEWSESKRGRQTFSEQLGHHLVHLLDLSLQGQVLCLPVRVWCVASCRRFSDCPRADASASACECVHVADGAQELGGLGCGAALAQQAMCCLDGRLLRQMSAAGEGDGKTRVCVKKQPWP